jgi:hypothetical protein
MIICPIDALEHVLIGWNHPFPVTPGLDPGVHGLPGQAHWCPAKAAIDEAHGLDSTVFCENAVE